MVDEVIYSELAKSFEAHGDFLIRDHAADVPSVLYPVAIAPAWIADSIPTAYGIAKAINVLLMTSAVVPVYLWARRLATPRWALVACALVLVMPSMLYTGVLMSENAFLPLFLAAAYTLALALERPTLLRQALLLGFVVLAVGVRLQALVLFLGHPGRGRAESAARRAGAWHPVGRRAARRCGRSGRPPPCSSRGPSPFVAYEEARGRSLSSLLGSYSSIATSNYRLRDGRALGRPARGRAGVLGRHRPGLRVPRAARARRWSAARRRPARSGRSSRSRPRRVVLVTIQVAAFASRFSLRIEERYLFPLAPLLFIALVVWIARGLPRPRVIAAVAALIPVALLLDVRLGDLLGVQILSDTFALIPVWRAAQLLDGGTDAAQTLLLARGGRGRGRVPLPAAAARAAHPARHRRVPRDRLVSGVRRRPRLLAQPAGLRGRRRPRLDRRADRHARRCALPLRRVEGAGLRRHDPLADRVLEPRASATRDRARAGRARPAARGERQRRPGHRRDPRERRRRARSTRSRRPVSRSPASRSRRGRCSRSTGCDPAAARSRAPSRASTATAGWATTRRTTSTTGATGASQGRRSRAPPGAGRTSRASSPSASARPRVVERRRVASAASRPSRRLRSTACRHATLTLPTPRGPYRVEVTSRRPSRPRRSGSPTRASSAPRSPSGRCHRVERSRRAPTASLAGRRLRADRGRPDPRLPWSFARPWSATSRLRTSSATSSSTPASRAGLPRATATPTAGTTSASAGSTRC